MPDTVGARLVILGASASERWHRAVRRLAPGPGVVRAWAPPGEGSSRLVMSEWFVIAALALALIWSRSEKAVPGGLVGPVGHLSAPILLVGAGLSLAGRRLFAARTMPASPPLTPMGLTWPLLVLALMVLGGSLYAQFVAGATHTFRTMGAYMLAACLVTGVVATSGNPVRLVTVCFLLLACTGIVSLWVTVGLFFTSSLAPFHELEFLIIPLIVYVATRKTELSLRESLLVWAGIVSAVFFHKNSAYLVAFGALAYLWLFHWRLTHSRANVLQRAVQTLAAGIAICSVLAGYFALHRFNEDYLPTGNTVFRLHMYEMAWNRFLESPVWGTFFSGSPVQKFTLYDTGVARNLLPTHSDVLDLLAHGGVIAVALWLLAHWLLVRAVWIHILRRRGDLDPHVIALGHTLLCMTLLGAVTYSFNPLLQNPARAMVIWGQFGLLAGLVCHCARLPERARGTRDVGSP